MTKIDYTKRCAVPGYNVLPSVQGSPGHTYSPHTRIFYGLDEKDAMHWLGLDKARDVPSPFLEQGPYRRPGRPVENEYGRQKQFFSKRISVPGDFDPNRRELQDGGRSEPCTQEIEVEGWGPSNSYYAHFEEAGVIT